MGPVLLLTQMFPPEIGAAPHRMYRLSTFLKSQGVPVEVVTWFPHYPQRVVYTGYKGWFHRESKGGISVRRFRPLILKSSMARRLLAECWLATGCALLGMMGPKPAVVYATTPSPLLALSGLFVSVLRRSPFVLEVRDLTWRYPAGVAGRPLNRFERLAERLMVWVAYQANLIVTTTQEQADFFRNQGIKESSLLVVPNGVARSDLSSVPSNLPREDQVYTVTYTGLVGLPQGLGVLVKAAELLKQHPIRFEIVGDGVEKSTLQAKCKRMGLTNVTFVPAVHRTELTDYYGKADVLFAHLRGAPVFESALPSKILDYMATGKPVIFGGRGVAKSLIDQIGAGLVVPPDDPEALAEAIVTLQKNREAAQGMGLKALAYVRANYVSENLFAVLYRRLCEVSK